LFCEVGASFSVHTCTAVTEAVEVGDEGRDDGGEDGADSGQNANSESVHIRAP
jgi:hypothetical protein